MPRRFSIKKMWNGFKRKLSGSGDVMNSEMAERRTSDRRKSKRRNSKREAAIPHNARNPEKGSVMNSEMAERRTSDRRKSTRRNSNRRKSTRRNSKREAAIPHNVRNPEKYSTSRMKKILVHLGEITKDNISREIYRSLPSVLDYYGSCYIEDAKQLVESSVNKMDLGGTTKQKLITKIDKEMNDALRKLEEKSKNDPFVKKIKKQLEDDRPGHKGTIGKDTVEQIIENVVKNVLGCESDRRRLLVGAIPSMDYVNLNQLSHFHGRQLAEMESPLHSLPLVAGASAALCIMWCATKKLLRQEKEN